MKLTTFAMSFYFLQMKTSILLVALYLNYSFALLLPTSFINGNSRKMLLSIILKLAQTSYIKYRVCILSRLIICNHFVL